VLKSGYLSGLITDETTARALTRLSEGFSRGVPA
jgi:DNA-binding transcriptional regulator LsrR (DeoR family)